LGDRSAPPRLAFIDFEASGLGPFSWPIEVGWALDDGLTDAVLINPAPSWSMQAWDPKAERLHGITPRMLSDLGIDPSDACKRLETALEGRTVYSDAPDWDGFWMLRLFQAAGRRCDIRLHDFARAMPPLSDAAKARLLQQADRLAPRRHRASEDALHLLTLYRLAAAGPDDG